MMAKDDDEGEAAAGREDAVTLSREEVADLEKKAEERELYRNELLRARADFENYQKRVRKDQPRWEDQAVRRFLRDLLPVIDNFERALESAGTAGATAESLEEGIRLTHQMMKNVLADHGVEEIRALGEPFNPEVHEAVAEEEVADRPTGEVVEVLQKGYLHGETVLRPSRVKVARNILEKESQSHADL